MWRNKRVSIALPTRRATAVIFALGVALRLPGLLFNGMGDIYEFLLDWGASLHHRGLVDAFGINYGILSYAAFGLAEAAGELVPRFWWAPYKLLVITADAGACLALLGLSRPCDRRLVLLLVWLNPWFILHGAYHGFWEGPHLLFGLLAVLVLRQVGGGAVAWAAAGVLIMFSGMFKPHGLIHFALPLGVFLTIEALRGTRRPLWSFTAGMAAVAGAATLAIWMAGGSALALSENFRSAVTVMPNLSNGGPGIWRFVSWAYMEKTGQQGQVWDMTLSNTALACWTLLAGALCLGIILAFARRLTTCDNDGDPAAARASGPILAATTCARWPSADVAFVFLTLGSLTLSQFGLHAHVNHAYPAMVLLAPWAAQDRALRRWWGAMILVLAAAHFSAFGFGDARLVPPECQLARYPAAAPLIGKVLELPAYLAPDTILAFQSAVNRSYVLSPQAISMLSGAVFIAACRIMWRMFRRVGEPTGVLGLAQVPVPPVGTTTGAGTTQRGTPPRPPAL